jgi:hypothetical protein
MDGYSRKGFGKNGLGFFLERKEKENNNKKIFWNFNLL